MSRANGETYFNNFTQSGYEELKEWTPTYYREIKEADVNLRFAGAIDDLIAESLEEWCKNQFAAQMNEETLSRMEAFFYMEGNAELDIEERRRLLGIALAGTGKISTEKIADWVRTYTGAESTFEFLHRLYIYIHLGESDRVGDAPALMETLGKKIPAHIAYTAQFRTELVFDWRDLEKIRLARLNVRMKLPFLYTYVLDGSWLLDGSHLLGGDQRIGVSVSIGSKFGLKTDEGISLRSGVRMGVNEDESVSHGLIIFLHTGTEESADIRAGVGIKARTAEDVPLVQTIRHSPDAWLLDGGVTLNGAKILDSIYEKEVIE